MKLLFSIICCFVLQISFAQNFSKYFENKTLRIDYIFAGNQAQQKAFIHQLVLLEDWHGRVENLQTTPIQGNGQIRVYDSDTKTLIYVLPFSSLFQEWITLDDSQTNFKSFENTYLIPYPKKKIDVEVVFFDSNHKECIVSHQVVDPKDILIKKAKKEVTPFKIIHKAKVANPIKIAIVAEGYKENEMHIFTDYALKTIESIWSHQVFAHYKDYFEVVAVQSVSEDSGISEPSKNIWLRTAVDSHFDTFYSSRYLTTPSVHKLHNVLENVPYQHIIILANTDVYGGGGILNSYTLTTTKNPQFAPVVVHEFGHSFGGLGDEYFYKNDIFDSEATKKEPWEKNITSLSAFETKWKHLIEIKTPIPTPKEWNNGKSVGAYEGLEGNGLYIPTLTCRMKINNTPDFCPVCSNALEQLILFYTSKQN